jgi:transposase
MDCASRHTRADADATRSAACAKQSASGATLVYLHPRGPDLSPIEQAFAKPKSAVAKDCR